MYCYNISHQYQGGGFLEHLNGANVHRVVEKYSQAKYKKKRMCLLSETQNVAFKTFPDGNDYYIYPRFTYNITVNTKIHSPEQGAAVVLGYLNFGTRSEL